MGINRVNTPHHKADELEQLLFGWNLPLWYSARVRRQSVLAVIALALGFAFATRASAQALHIILDDRPGPEKFQLIHVPDLLTLMSDPSSHVQIYDANFPDVRMQFGVIDGAHLLSSYDNFNVAKELPPDKSTKLVFYCYDKRCMASHFAARRAIDAGYKNVEVMSDGIVGWYVAQQPIHRVSEAEAESTE